MHKPWDEFVRGPITVGVAVGGARADGRCFRGVTGLGLSCLVGAVSWGSRVGHRLRASTVQ